MLRLRRPAPPCSAVFKSNLANAVSPAVDGGVSVGSCAQMSQRLSCPHLVPQPTGITSRGMYMRSCGALRFAAEIEV
jgi:hypothetical protein